MGRLYEPAGEYTGEPGKGLARRGEYGLAGEFRGLCERKGELTGEPGRGLTGGRELGRLDGRGRELYELTGWLRGFSK